MDLQDQRDLQLLLEVEKGGNVSQRTLAQKLGVALGLTNLYLKRLARKGYIKITTMPRHRIKYLLTPRGIAEKTRLTYEFMEYSLTYYRRNRQRLSELLQRLVETGAKRIVIYGTGELAELAYLSVREKDLALVGFVDGARTGTFLSYPLWSVESLSQWEYDAVLIGALVGVPEIRERLLAAGVPEQKIVAFTAPVASGTGSARS